MAELLAQTKAVKKAKHSVVHLAATSAAELVLH